MNLDELRAKIKATLDEARTTKDLDKKHELFDKAIEMQTTLIDNLHTHHAHVKQMPIPKRL